MHTHIYMLQGTQGRHKVVKVQRHRPCMHPDLMTKASTLEMLCNTSTSTQPPSRVQCRSHLGNVVQGLQAIVAHTTVRIAEALQHRRHNVPQESVPVLCAKANSNCSKAQQATLHLALLCYHSSVDGLMKFDQEHETRADVLCAGGRLCGKEPGHRAGRCTALCSALIVAGWSSNAEYAVILRSMQRTPCGGWLMMTWHSPGQVCQ
jgi:hypothetical protein